MRDRNGDKHTQETTKTYGGITFLPTTYKLFANIIKKNSLNEYGEDEMVEEHCGFRKGRVCTGAIFTAQQIGEKRKEHNLPPLLLFIDFERAYESVNRDKLWELVDNKIRPRRLNR